MSEYKRLFGILLKNIIRLFLEFAGGFLSVFIKPERNLQYTLDDKILLMSATKLAESIKIGDLQCQQVVEAYIKQAKRVNGTLNAIVEDHFDSARKRATLVDSAVSASFRGEKDDHIDLDLPFVGVPLTVKETIALAGASYTAGIAIRSNKQARDSNPAVDQLIKSGMIPIASTNTPCQNLWFDSYNLLHGRTNNPYDRSRIPGGSSGGEAALIASAGSVVGVGSDLAGSIRIPCHFCGIFGHKPTPLSVSTDNSFPACRGDRDMLRGLGPMTRYAVDLLPMLKLMLTSDEAKSRMRLDEPVDMRTIKIFYCEDLNDPLSSSCDKDILSALRAAVEHLSSKFNIQSSPIRFENFKYGLPLWSACGEGGQVYSHEHPDGFVQFNPWMELIKCLFGTSMYPLNSIVCGVIEKLGAKKGSSKQNYLKKKADQLRDEFNLKLGDNGVLIMPTHPQAAPNHQTTLFKFLNCSYTAVANTLHAPITQCPLGMSREGLPIGVQLIATPYNDRLTLAVAQELERAFGGWIPPVKTV